jgi:hypothetical protein
VIPVPGHGDHSIEYREVGTVAYSVVGISPQGVVTVDWTDSETIDTEECLLWCATCGEEIDTDTVAQDGVWYSVGLGFDADRFPETDWRYEVANGDTRLGYSDWVAHQARIATEDGS